MTVTATWLSSQPRKWCWQHHLFFPSPQELGHVARPALQSKAAQPRPVRRQQSSRFLADHAVSHEPSSSAQAAAVAAESSPPSQARLLCVQHQDFLEGDHASFQWR
mmetsp:Transcript_75596/g.190162  ORF Transcript_75596/g.190162 Transcript_75596/m.190162 type:complete len:106 (-) Transcript_75596:368-685(-)